MNFRFCGCDIAGWGLAMALLGAPAHGLLRTHFNSSLVRDSSTLPGTSKDAAALRNPSKLKYPQLAFEDLSANFLAGYGENSQHSRRCVVYSASSSSASASSALHQVTFCGPVLGFKFHALMPIRMAFFSLLQ